MNGGSEGLGLGQIGQDLVWRGRLCTGSDGSFGWNQSLQEEQRYLLRATKSPIRRSRTFPERGT